MNAPLALLGAAPAFPDKVHVGRPNVGDKAALFRRLDEIYERRWFSNLGACVQEFEQRLKDLLGVKHCIPVCNATVALEIASRALDLKGEVIVPSFTFIATAHALQWQEITPVFCDVDPTTHNLDPAQIERHITPRTTGIVGVHLWGRPCETEAIDAIAKKHGLKVMYDASHALGCSHAGRKIGNFGSCEVFSFHATKFVNACEGGAIATNDDELAAKIRLMKNFGFAGYDKVIHVGTNGKMNEFSAAMGLTALESIDRFIAANRAHHDRYAADSADIPGLSLIRYDEHSNFQYVIFEVDADTFGLTRDEIVSVLHAENVLARRYFFPGCHRQKPYIDSYPDAGRLLPQTERLCERVLALPTGTAITDADVRAICGVLRTAHQRAGEVRAALASAK